jgi:hypothetical protein
LSIPLLSAFFVYFTSENKEIIQVDLNTETFKTITLNPPPEGTPSVVSLKKSPEKFVQMIAYRNQQAIFGFCAQESQPVLILFSI